MNYRSDRTLRGRIATFAVLALSAAGLMGGGALAEECPMGHHHMHAGMSMMAKAHFGASGMPFDLSRTLHIFTPLPGGGEQDVVSTDNDAAQIALIRQHLSVQAGLRAKGDYSGPAAMHGLTMPGLQALAAGAGRMHIQFVPLPAGGRILYESKDRALVRAVHEWLHAQACDHGADAMLSHQ
ncbi:hypothetical protein AA13595_2118 [Gluconacetobacter johannae DSM 13595]|uniref:Aspartate carbamoyltransferase n=1 Tax=Gluconacetobacter johannae TaxID=112140 RepID=A0A7W4J5V7_9PROT|nr:aspartate carbamoyltransferase [Gluconacetobacter johannae]MBB2175028.1 aspartate carbamoyltransferase [Gluconacetobacter johannae]GBQ87265.1 hypothetical protein AA13595_2118 [Gluconacetobacter johannae DSM 13595]